MIHTDGLSKQFGSFVALVPCTLNVPRGEVFGLLGPNGAGKSTLIRLLMGFLQPTAGSAHVNNFDIVRQTVNVKSSVSYLPSSPKLFRTMSGHSVLRFFARIRRDGDLPRALQIAKRLDLNLRPWVAFMSTGMRQKLAIAATFSVRAPLLILDEPTENLDPTVRRIVADLVREARADGQSVLFSSHVLSEVEEVADRVGILRSGQLVHEQSVSSIRRTHKIHATIQGSLPPIDDNLTPIVTIEFQSDGLVRLNVAGELAPVLKWLAAANLTDMHVEPVGLSAVYERFHHVAGTLPS